MKTMPQAVPDDALYTVAGILVMAQPQQCAQVSRGLTALPGVELGPSDESGHLVVTVEELPGQQLLTRTMHEIQCMSGVLSAALVYSRSEQVGETGNGRGSDE